MNPLSWFKNKIVRPIIREVDKEEPRYRAKRNYYYMLDKKGIKYEGDFIGINPDGYCVVYCGAPSDGCSPCYLLFGLFYVGSPDGPQDPETNMPVTAPAFFLHDHLLNERSQTGMTAKECHHEFCKEIKKTTFWYKSAHCAIVKGLGPRD